MVTTRISESCSRAKKDMKGGDDLQICNRIALMIGTYINKAIQVEIVSYSGTYDFIVLSGSLRNRIVAQLYSV